MEEELKNKLQLDYKKQKETLLQKAREEKVKMEEEKFKKMMKLIKIIKMKKKKKKKKK